MCIVSFMTEHRDIVLVRNLHAPVEEVWQAWTDPGVFRQWWGPTGFTCEFATLDLRPGGRFVWNMHAPAEMGGFDMYTAGTIERVVPHERIEFSQGLADRDGNPIDPTSLGMPADFPTSIASELQFRATPNGTELTAIEREWAVGQERDRSESGLSQCLDKLEALLAARR
jgi:uncharacterized protein YndB with AHSA1/START domain